MKKLFAFVTVLRRGSVVADPVTWKTRSALVIALSGLIVAAAQAAEAFGYDTGIDADTATAIAGGIAACVGVWSTFATSDKVGILPADPPADPLPALHDDMHHGA
jgi:hypothetical protein